MTKNAVEQIYRTLAKNDVSHLHEGDFAPNEVTQYGLAKKLDVDVASVSRYLADLEHDKKIKSKLLNIRDRPRKVQCYYLTKKGREVADELE